MNKDTMNNDTSSKYSNVVNDKVINQTKIYQPAVNLSHVCSLSRLKRNCQTGWLDGQGLLLP